MTTNKETQLKRRGIGMLVIFFAILGILFTPIFPGRVNGLDYIDNLFNMISKGSSDFIDLQRQESKKFTTAELDLRFSLKNENEATEFARQLTLAGATASTAGKEVKLLGKMTAIIDASLSDCRAMFDNDGESIQQRYGFTGKKALYNWWFGYKAMVNSLNNRKKFKEASFLETLCTKAIEPAYNYYGVKAKPWKANIALIISSLIFYVAYTVWYGFGILYIFEGWGLKTGH